MAQVATLKLNRTIKLRIDGRLLTTLTDEIKRRGIPGLSLSHLVREILSTWAQNGKEAGKRPPTSHRHRLVASDVTALLPTPEES